MIGYYYSIDQQTDFLAGRPDCDPADARFECKNAAGF